MISTPESALRATYAEEAIHYTHALALAEQLAPTLARGESVEPLLGHIGVALSQVQCLEERLAPVKARWRATGETPGSALVETLDGITVMIRQLHGLVELAYRQASPIVAPASGAWDSE